MSKTETQLIKDRLKAIDDRLAEVPKLQEERARILIALEVLAGLPQDELAEELDPDWVMGQPSRPVVHEDLKHFHLSHIRPARFAGGGPAIPLKVPIKMMVLTEFAAITPGLALSKQDLGERIGRKGYTVNPDSLGSTLSNMVKGGILVKCGMSEYALPPRRSTLELEGPTEQGG